MNAPVDFTMELQKGPKLSGQSAGQKTAPKQKTSPAPSSAAEDDKEETSKDYFNRSELLSAIKKDKKLRVNASFASRYESFWDALEKAFVDFDVKKSKQAANLYGMPAIMHTACKNMQVLQTEPNHALFTSRNGAIEVKNGAIQFIPELDKSKSTAKKSVHKPFTYDDAFNAISLAAASGFKSLSIEGGTHHERVMYKRAILAYNASVPENLRFKMDKSFPADIVPHASVDKKFKEYMSRANTEEKTAAPKKKTSTAKKKTVAAAATGAKSRIDGLKNFFKKAQDDPANTPKKAEPVVSKESVLPDPVKKTGKGPDECKEYLKDHLASAEVYGTASDENGNYEVYKLDVTEDGAIPRTLYFAKHPSDPCLIIYIHEKDGSACYMDDHIYMDHDFDHKAHPKNLAASIANIANNVKNAPKPLGLG